MITPDEYNQLQSKLSTCFAEADSLVFQLGCVVNSSGIDEPYKVTGDPDFDALGEVQRHLDEAREALERFVSSLTKSESPKEVHVNEDGEVVYIDYGSVFIQRIKP